MTFQTPGSVDSGFWVGTGDVRFNQLAKNSLPSLRSHLQFSMNGKSPRYSSCRTVRNSAFSDYHRPTVLYRLVKYGSSTMRQRSSLLCFPQLIPMRKLALSVAAAHIVALLLFTITSHAQAPASQPRVTSKPQAQTIKIKLVNGRNGRPMASSHVNVWVGKERKDATAIPTDENGVALLRLTDGADEPDTHEESKACGPNCVINPVFKYDDLLRINVGYVLCQPDVGSYSWLRITDMPTSRVLQDGIVMKNTCGSTRATAEPGEVVIFVRPLSWWEMLKE